MAPIPMWNGNEMFSLAEEAFTIGFGVSNSERMVIRKPRTLVDQYVSLLARIDPKRVVDIGIAQGGSIALTSLIADPETLVGIELAPGRVDALDRLLERIGTSDRVHLHYGVNQSDRKRLREIVQTSFGGAPLDLVVDDGAHRLEATRATFETVFPSVRPGGLYLIEDWSWQLNLAAQFDAEFSDFRRRRSALSGAPTSDTIAPRPLPADDSEPNFRTVYNANSHNVPLERLAAELLLTRACGTSALGSLTVNQDWIIVERGPADLDPATFRVADHFVDYTDHRSILAHPDPA